MSKLKQLLSSFDEEEKILEDEVEVYADSVKQALSLAAEALNVDVSSLEYEIVKKGHQGFFGMGRTPYKVVVRPILQPEHVDLNELDSKLSTEISDLDFEVKNKNESGSFKIRTTKTGVWLIVTKPRGEGRPVVISDVLLKIDTMRVRNYSADTVKNEVKNASGEPVKIAEWIPNPEYDGSMHVEVSSDEMKATVYFDAPRYSGRHMDFDDIINAMKNSGIVYGVNEKRINDYLSEMNYSRPLVAAEGTLPKNGEDAYVEYKVRIENKIDFSEIDGRVDFKDLNLIENVVTGQLLAVKVPAEQGIQGRTVTNRLLPARSGRDTSIQHGEGTILSDDGRELTAEKNGQVVLKAGRIIVDDVLVIQGDVNMETGDILMLGSILITGNVLDNFKVKASGNIEVRGSVQKAFLEAEGDIIVKGGINGRDEGRVETTGGTVYAKFVRSSRLIAEKNVIGTEELLNSRVDAGKLIYCNGKRAQISGGVLRAGEEVNARAIGADSYIRTEIFVGLNPKVLQQLNDLESVLKETAEELEKLSKDITTLNNRRRTTALTEEQKEMLSSYTSRSEKLEERKQEVFSEMEELREYMKMIEQKGLVSAEKNLYPGVEIFVKDQKLKINDEYSDVRITFEGGDWRFGKYELPLGQQPKYARRSFSRRR